MKNLKRHFSQWLRSRFFLRFHMSLILGSTFLAGLVATKILLELNVNRLWLRYAIAVGFAYLLFLGLIRLWLWYVGISARRERDEGSLDVPADLVEAVCDIAQFSAPEPAMQTGGGDFGGAGASASYDTPAVSSANLASASRGSGGSTKGGFSIDADEAIVVVLLAALVLSLFVAGGYLIYAAPSILSEAAFEAVLAAALVRRARKVDSPGWIGSVFKATALPFFVILALSMILGWYAQHSCPTAIKIRDALTCASRTTEAT